MEVLVPAPVGEGHQLLDPVPVAVNSTASMSHCRSDSGWWVLFQLLGDEIGAGRYSIICPGFVPMNSRAQIGSLLCLTTAFCAVVLQFRAPQPGPASCVCIQLGAVTSGSLCLSPTSTLQIPVIWMHKLACTQLIQREGF